MRKKESWARSLARIIKSMKNIIDDKSQNVKTTKQNQAMPFRVVFLSSTSRSPSSTVVIFQWFFDFLIASDWPKNDRVSLMERFLRCAIFARFRAMAKVKTQIKSSLHSFFLSAAQNDCQFICDDFFFLATAWIGFRPKTLHENTTRATAKRRIISFCFLVDLLLGDSFSIWLMYSLYLSAQFSRFSIKRSLTTTSCHPSLGHVYKLPWKHRARALKILVCLCAILICC